MKIYSLIIIFIAITITSCNKPGAPDCFKENGNEATVTRSIEPFHAINLDANLDVEIANGTDYKVEITGPANLINKVNTSVKSNTLNIQNHNECNFVRGYKRNLTMKVYAPYYKFVVTNSIGKITTTPDFNQDTLAVRTEAGDIYLYGNYNEIRTSSHGNGNIYLKCSMNRLYVYMNGTNYLYADEANISSYAFVESVSIANAYVNAPAGGTLEYHLWKQGNLYYKGNPTNLSGIIAGKGQVIKEN